MQYDQERQSLYSEKDSVLRLCSSEPFSNRVLYQVSKQELYFVKENYKIFSTEVSAREKQGQNDGGPHQKVIGSLVISSAGRPF